MLVSGTGFLKLPVLGQFDVLSVISVVVLADLAERARGRESRVTGGSLGQGPSDGSLLSILNLLLELQTFETQVVTTKGLTQSNYT